MEDDKTSRSLSGGCLRLTVCDSVLYEVVCAEGDNLLR